jgi:alanine dehydrogenase
MIIGVPKEIKRDEYRVAMLPVGVEELTAAGHKVLFERGAGMGSGLPDTEYQQSGAELVSNAREIFSRSELVVKVKEPQPSEWEMLQPGQAIFT